MRIFLGGENEFLEGISFGVKNGDFGKKNGNSRLKSEDFGGKNGEFQNKRRRF